MVDISEYKVGVVLSMDDKSKPGGKPLRACTINIGNDDEPIVVVTSATNVREGSRVVVAPIGSTVLTEEGEELEIQKATVGGVVSSGMLCDSRMLGWSGGAAGVAVQVPEGIDIGAAPPATKPRPGGGGDSAEAASGGGGGSGGGAGLYEKKLTKEEKKKLAAEKRAAKKATKE